MRKTKEEVKQQREERILTALDKVVRLFESGDVPEAVAVATFPPLDVPCAKWSLRNRILTILEGTSDARGFRQWKSVGRSVKKGEKAFFILSPLTIKIDEGENGEYRVIGFKLTPVFAVEQTEGEVLEYENIKLPRLPLMEKAEEWRIDVRGVALQGEAYGWYDFTGGEKIRLCTPEEKTFFHELSHAAHGRITALKGGQNARQEIVAELSAQVLARLVGRSEKDTTGNSYRYIKRYAESEGKEIGRACFDVLGDVEKVLNLILS